MASPVLRWLGGKRELVPAILPLIQEPFAAYYELCLGGGSLYFALEERGLLDEVKRRGKVVLGDSNPQLMNFYRVLRDAYKALLWELDEAVRVSAARGALYTYYRVRADFNVWLPEGLDALTEVERVRQAARFYYLNQTAINGLYRISRAGYFNASLGKNRSGAWNTLQVDEDRLLAASIALAGTRLVDTPYAHVLPDVLPGSLLYFDPPYVDPGKPGHTAYTQGGWTWEDTVQLRNYAHLLAFPQPRLFDERCQVILSQPDVPEVRALFSPPFEIHEVAARRRVNSDGGGRGPVRELLIVGRS